VTTDDAGPQLSAKAHGALLAELWAGEPGKHHCFTGTDEQLLQLVADHRAQEARQR
jgi:hypothetical protein